METKRAKVRRIPHLSLVEPRCDVFSRWITTWDLSQLTCGSEVLTQCLGPSIKIAWSAVLTAQLTGLWLNFRMYMLLKGGHLLLWKCLSTENVMISLVFVCSVVHKMIFFSKCFSLWISHTNHHIHASHVYSNTSSLVLVSGSNAGNADVEGTLGR